MKIHSAVLAAIVAAAVVVPVQAQVKEHPLPRIVEKDGRYALFVDGAPYLMLGAQIHNSSSWPATLPKVWPAMEYLHVNTVEAPVYWEQFEQKPGQYDYTLIDTLLAQARQHSLRLVLLWFGTWKNGSQHYMPEWMKLDTDRYPHMIDKNGRAVDSPSPFAAASLEAAAIMIANGPDDYYFGGGGMRVDFTANTPGPANVGLGDVEEGKFVNGKWVVLRELAGDDTAQGEILVLRPNTILHVSLYRFP